jgi:hypothetical protein
MAQVIPTSTDLPDYQQITNLDGRDYALRFVYNTREDRWYLQIADQDNDPIVGAIKVVVEIDLLGRVTDSRRPPGMLIARDYSAPDDQPKLLNEDPGYADLGARVSLLYFDQSEVAEL